MRLTDLSIRKLSPPSGGQKTYFDDLLPGFGIRVSQGGTKSFVVMHGPRRSLKTIGRFPDLGLSDARREAKRVQSEVSSKSGRLPMEREPLKFELAKEQFLKASAQRNKPRTTSDYNRLLNRHFKFKKHVHEISRADVMAVIAKLGATPSEQSHAFVAIRTLMNWCTKQGIIDASPVPAMSARNASRSHILSPQALTEVLSKTENHLYPFGPIVRLLVLTGQRRGEIASLKWDWIDDKSRTITLPASLTKNGRIHTFPYGDLVQETLETVPHLDEYLFPSRSSKGTIFNGWGKAKERFDRELDNVAPYTLHDLRRTFASTLAGLGTPIHVTEKLLNHVSGTVSGVAAIYNRHAYIDEMRTAIAEYDAHLVKLRNTC